jgi:CheY-like chemotaxis protein
LVEDERSMRDLLALMLSKEGYRVDTAENGAQARERIDKESLYDLLITDISMPGMTGLELLAYTRQASPETEVILMTAYGSKRRSTRARPISSRSRSISRR